MKALKDGCDVKGFPVYAMLAQHQVKILARPAYKGRTKSVLGLARSFPQEKHSREGVPAARHGVQSGLEAFASAAAPDAAAKLVKRAGPARHVGTDYRFKYGDTIRILVARF